MWVASGPTNSILERIERAFILCFMEGSDRLLVFSSHGHRSSKTRNEERRKERRKPPIRYVSPCVRHASSTCIGKRAVVIAEVLVLVVNKSSSPLIPFRQAKRVEEGEGGYLNTYITLRVRDIGFGHSNLAPQPTFYFHPRLQL